MSQVNRPKSAGEAWEISAVCVCVTEMVTVCVFMCAQDLAPVLNHMSVKSLPLLGSSSSSTSSLCQFLSSPHNSYCPLTPVASYFIFDVFPLYSLSCLFSRWFVCLSVATPISISNLRLPIISLSHFYHTFYPFSLSFFSPALPGSVPTLPIWSPPPPKLPVTHYR